MPADDTSRIPFTQTTYDQMIARRAQLLLNQTEVLARLKDAREQGDLSENGAYKYAKFELGNIRRELNRLNRLITKGYVATRPAASDRAAFGSTVTIESNGQSFTFMLVSSFESNPAEHKLSTTSPIGSAVLNRRVGDRCVVLSPRGEISYQIIAIS
jgi:transcription elongation factor GreA